MKNKIRGNYLKRIFACCALVFLLFSVSVPCFARGVYPTTDNIFANQLGFDLEYGWNYVNKFAVAEIVEKAYQLNYFGCGVPVAIVVRSTPTGSTFGVYTVPYTNITETETPFGTSYSGIEPPAKGTSRADVVGNIALTSNGLYYDITAINSTTGVQYPMLLYLINQDYTFYPSYATPTLENYDSVNPEYSDFVISVGMVNVHQSLKSWVIAYREGEGDWRIVNQCDSDEMPTADIVDDDLQAINDWYDEQLSGGTYDQIFQYELDIPSIITAIPNGAKQIINNAFGFEIFGINVAGFLSVLLIVSIVGFVVKWLMSR